ncbi:MAG: PAC2 family protein [Propionibacteriaceae bacterium]|nr:PAC2 family protein [Propionibacteriaceae bacterium]
MFRDIEFAALRNPAIVAAFSGWNDAGEAASGVIEHLSDCYESETVAVLDPEDYYDFQVSRPHIKREDDKRVVEWATTEVVLVHHRERDLILIGGPEPNYRWRSFIDYIMALVEDVKPELVLLVGALLSDSPHSRPIEVAVTTGDAKLAEEYELNTSDYEGPIGILGVLAHELEDAEIPTVSFWAAIPHYVAEPPNPKGTLALLTRLEEFLNASLDSGDLPQQAADWTEQVDEMVRDNPEILLYISALEERSDLDTPPPTGEMIAAEFERYLKRRGRNPSS